jgi:hypothetical protein
MKFGTHSEELISIHETVCIIVTIFFYLACAIKEYTNSNRKNVQKMQFRSLARVLLFLAHFYKIS